MEYSERIERFEAFLDRGTLVQKDYGDGVTCACWLTALVPEAASPKWGVTRKASVPAEVLPSWAVCLVTGSADAVKHAQFPAVSRRFLRVARRFPVLGAGGWERAKQRFAANVIELSMQRLLNKELPEVRALLVDVSNVLRGDPTRVSRAALEAGLEEAKVPHNEARDAGAVRLLEFAKDVIHGAHTNCGLFAQDDEIVESFLSALEEQCRLEAL